METLSRTSNGASKHYTSIKKMHLRALLPAAQSNETLKTGAISFRAFFSKSDYANVVEKRGNLIATTLHAQSMASDPVGKNDIGLVIG